MNYALILAAGVGQRMRNGGLPKQFLKLLGKPIIIYTLEKFENCQDIDEMIIVCHGDYVEYLQELFRVYQLKKISKIIVGGSNRQDSIQKGLQVLAKKKVEANDIVTIHDGVRPLVQQTTISETIRVAKLYGCAIAVHPVTESVVITDSDEAKMDDFKKRSDTYTMTSPQTFLYEKIVNAYEQINLDEQSQEIPLLDAAMVYARTGQDIKLVKEQGTNLKVTTPEDFYFLKAILELEENKFIFGL